MARSRAGYIDIAAPPDVAFRALCDAVAALAKPETVQVEGWVVTGTAGVSMRSWGDLLTGTVLTGPRGTRVTIESKSWMPMQFIDWGKHRANIGQILSQVGALNGPAT